MVGTASECETSVKRRRNDSARRFCGEDLENVRRARGIGRVPMTRRTCRSTASTTVATVSLSRATLSQKSRAVSASSCVFAYFSASSTRTRYAWGDAAGEEAVGDETSQDVPTTRRRVKS